MTTMSLRKSESVCRLLIGISLAFGFLGFATHSHADRGADELAVQSKCATTQSHDSY